MRNLTIKLKNNFFNYDNTTSFQFQNGKFNNEKELYWANVWDINGKYTEVHFDNKEEWDYAQNKLEQGLINDFVFIDLNKKEE